MVDDTVFQNYALSMAIPFVVVFFEIITHILVARFFIKKGTIISTLVAYSVGLVILAVLENQFLNTGRLPLSETLALTAVNFVLYSAMAFFYFSFVNIGETSVRIRVLRELEAAPKGLTHEELTAKYSVNHIIEARIDRLLSSGEMVFKNDRYYIAGKPRMLLVAKTTQRIKILLLGKMTLDPELVRSELQ